MSDVAVVTGAGSGIGRAIATKLAQRQSPPSSKEKLREPL